jgi:hypothetical protein
MPYRLVTNRGAAEYADAEHALNACEAARKVGIAAVLWGVRQDGTLAEAIARIGLSVCDARDAKWGGAS